MSDYQDRCEFYDDKRCSDTKKYFELKSCGEVNEDLFEQREELCSRIRPECTKRAELLDNCTETI